MSGYCSTGQIPQQAVVLMEEEEVLECMPCHVLFTYNGNKSMALLTLARHRARDVIVNSFDTFQTVITV